VTDEDLDLVACDDCDELLSQEEYNEQDGYCSKCHAKHYRRCRRCKEEYHESDAHKEFPDCCDSCGDEEHTERADDLWENQITDLVGSWAGEEYEIPRLRRLLAYAKQLSK
jgi:hypothetical protein